MQRSSDPSQPVRRSEVSDSIARGIGGNVCPTSPPTRNERSPKQIIGYITRFRDVYPGVSENIIDVTYRELVSDPLAVVRRIYDRLGIQLKDSAAERMRRLASARSAYKKRVRGSVPTGDLGLDRVGVSHHFEDYSSRFGIPCQPIVHRILSNF